MKFSSDLEIARIPDLVREFFDNVVTDYEPLFLSDEATIWDVSMLPAEELVRRCSEYYGKTVSMNDLKQPLWKLLRQLNEGRGQTASE